MHCTVTSLFKQWLGQQRDSSNISLTTHFNVDSIRSQLCQAQR